jgi:hypothetical protein
MELKDLLRAILKDNEEIYSLTGKVTEIDEIKRTCTVSPHNGDAELFDVRLQSSVNVDFGLVTFPKLQSDVTVSFFNKDLSFISQTSEIEKISLKIGGLDIFLDKDNYLSTLKNTKIGSDDYEINSKNTKFTTELIFEVISDELIKATGKNFIFEALAAFNLTAVNINLSGVLDVLGATKITGATEIIGAVDITGALTLIGAASLTGPVAIAGAVTLNGGGLGGVPKADALVSEVNKIKTDFDNLKTKFNNWVVTPNDGGAKLKTQLATWLPNVTPIDATNISNPDFKH